MQPLLSEVEEGGGIHFGRHGAVCRDRRTRYSHIVDPRTGLGLTNRIQASVVGPNAMTTDALATTVCILGPERGQRLVKRLKKRGARVVTRSRDETRIAHNQIF